jgi:hypothetical protein
LFSRKISTRRRRRVEFGKTSQVLSGSKGGTLKVWNSGTYRVENMLSYFLERAWCVALRRDANEVVVGFNEGVVVIKVYMLILHPIIPSLIDGT